MDKVIRETQYIYPKALTIKIWSENKKKIEVNTICKSLLVFGQYQGISIGLRLSQPSLNSI
jgi:hypothetical protein